MESKSKGCKAYKMQIIFDDFKAKTRKAKALASCVNSLAHLKARLHLNKCGWGTTRAKTRRGKVADIAQSENKAIASTHIRKIFFA
jgi:hypothetical protein